MKRLMITVLVAGVFTITTAGAQTLADGNSNSTEESVEEFKKINATSLPETIKEDVKNDFTKAQVQEAYVNDKMEYKIILRLEETEVPKIVFANAKRGLLNIE
jgi:hypothetical protein